MFQVAIYDPKKRLVATYANIHTIKYINILGETVIVAGDEMLTHEFSLYADYHLYSDDGNYAISKSVIGTFEVTKSK